MAGRIALLCLLFCAVVLPAQTRLQTQQGASLTLDDARGRLGVLRDAVGRALVTGGTLWSIGFRDGKRAHADAFLANGGAGSSEEAREVGGVRNPRFSLHLDQPLGAADRAPEIDHRNTFGHALLDCQADAIAEYGVTDVDIEVLEVVEAGILRREQ